MRPRINLSLQVAAGILALIAPCFLAAQGAPAVSLEEQLSAQYTLVKMGSDSSGPAVVEPGTILAIQKGGILGVPYGNMNMLPAKYQDGTLHPPATATSNSATSMGSKVCGFFGKCNSTKEQVGKQTTTRLFQVGEKVYPSKIEVHPDKDIVSADVLQVSGCVPIYQRIFGEGQSAADRRCHRPGLYHRRQQWQPAERRWLRAGQSGCPGRTGCAGSK